MISGKRSSVVLLYESVGFLAIIVLSWLNELVGLPYLLFGGSPHQPDFRESAMETMVVLVIAAPILLLSWRLASRLRPTVRDSRNPWETGPGLPRAGGMEYIFRSRVAAELAFYLVQPSR